jgi:hypothetical protein
MDDELIQLTATQIKAGDPSDATFGDGFDDVPYCFSLKTEHREGALSAIARYVPWWKQIDSDWGPRNEERVRFKSWTKKRSCADKKKASHAAMNGGELCVDFGEEEDAFLESYAKCLLSGCRMFFVERLNYPWDNYCFRLYVDLDFEQLRGITERGVEAAASICASAVSRFFPKSASSTIVCATTYKQKIKNFNGNQIARIKTGVHIHWPTHYVTQKQALDIRETILSEMIESFGRREEPEKNLWEDVVDKSVYSNNGLRMLGSCKTEPCPEKANGCKRGGDCKRCNGAAVILDVDQAGRTRPYMMLCVLNKPTLDGGDAQFAVRGRDQNLEDVYRKDLVLLVRDTKIRTTLTESTVNNGFELPRGAPIYVADKKTKRQPSGSKNERCVDASDPCNVEIQNIIRKGFGAIYSSVVVRKVTRSPEQYTVQVTGLNCRYCQNIAREHHSQNIYFLIKRDGIFQRCFDNGPRTSEMIYGLCKDYCGGGIPLSSLSSNILWPPDPTDALSVFGTSVGVALSTKRGYDGNF